MEETFSSLLINIPHWEFEILVSVIFASFEGLVVYPLWQRWRKHHRIDDAKIAELEKRLDKAGL